MIQSNMEIISLVSILTHLMDKFMDFSFRCDFVGNLLTPQFG